MDLAQSCTSPEPRRELETFLLPSVKRIGTKDQPNTPSTYPARKELNSMDRAGDLKSSASDNTAKKRSCDASLIFHSAQWPCKPGDYQIVEQIGIY